MRRKWHFRVWNYNLFFKRETEKGFKEALHVRISSVFFSKKNPLEDFIVCFCAFCYMNRCLWNPLSPYFRLYFCYCTIIYIATYFVILNGCLNFFKNYSKIKIFVKIDAFFIFSLSFYLKFDKSLFCQLKMSIRNGKMRTKFQIENFANWFGTNLTLD